MDNSIIDSILNTTKSLDSKSKTIDSILSLKNLTIKEKSYCYHSYAKYLAKNNELDLAIKSIKESISLRKKNNDIQSLKKSLYNLSLYLKRKGLFYESIKALNELIDLPKEDRLRMKAYSQLIVIYNHLGDFEKSIQYFNKSTPYYIKNNNYSSLYRNYIRVSIAYISMDYQNTSLIISCLKKADSLNKYVKIDVNDQYLINLRLGNVYEEINQNELAFSYYEKTLLIAEKINDSIKIASLYNNMGYLYAQDSIYDKAYNYFKEGLIYAKENAERKSAININLADYYLRNAKYDKALQCYNKALDLLVFKEVRNNTSLSLSDIDNSQFKLKILDYLTQRGGFWFARYKASSNNSYLNKALNDFHLADQLTDIISLNAGEQLSKLFWREKGANLYIKAIAVCNALERTDLAYYFMEKNKALLLLEHVNDEQAKLVSKLPEELVARDFSFRQQITQAKNDANLLFDLKSAYARFKDSLAIAYPDYARLRKKLPLLNLKEHREQFIRSNEVTLQFMVNNEQAFGLVITKENTFLYEIKNVDALNKHVASLRQKLQKPFITKEEVLSYNKVAYEIFNSLLPSAIYDQLKGKKLTVATDGNLQNIPLEALVTNETESEKNIPYLILSNQIDYVYSFSYLKSNNEVLRSPKKTFLGLAPRTFQNDSLGVLTNSVKEITTINTIFKDQVYTEATATKETFLNNFNDYNIVHLATHSGLDEQTEPWLAFYDSRANLDEIYATKNQADLVVLSACKTSQGTLKSGEGVMSLARGFFFSGTNTVISSLWNLNDKTTEHLMVDFYEKIQDGNTKSEALHKAKLNYLETNSGSAASPFYWSSFILIGDGHGVIESSSPSYLYIVIGLSIIFVLISIFYRKIKKNG